MFETCGEATTPTRASVGHPGEVGKVGIVTVGYRLRPVLDTWSAAHPMGRFPGDAHLRAERGLRAVAAQPAQADHGDADGSFGVRQSTTHMRPQMDRRHQVTDFGM